MPELTVAVAEAAARKVLDHRVAAVRTLADAEKADTATWAAALRAGWSDADLRKVGFEPPARRGVGRPRATRSAPAAAAPAT